MLVRLSKILFLSIVIELCLGGGGRLTAIGPLSLRMVLFCLAVTLSLVLLTRGNQVGPRYWKLLGGFIIVTLVGVVMGLFRRSQIHLLWEDIKPLLYFLILPFFVLTIDREQINECSKIFRIGSISIAIVFFLTLLFINTGVLPFLDFYDITEASQEFFYRGQLSFFYKGFLFLGVGSIFFYFSKSKKKYLFIALLIAALFASVTRGLIVALVLTFAVYCLMEKKFIVLAFLSILGLVVAIWGNKGTLNLSRWLDAAKNKKSYQEASPHLFGDRNFSDEGRLRQIREVIEGVSPVSVLVGHGFGQGVPSRPVRMEITYLEIFHKQGLFGLMFWGMLGAMIFLSYLRSNQSAIAKSLFFSTVFVFIESTTNPYLNNPIGMSVVLLSLVSLDKLKKEM